MKGKIFKIKNMEDELVLPITTTEAVYSEDGKTLNDEIDDINSSLDNIVQFTVNVKDFGAKGDGVTDDTQAFKDAIYEAGRLMTAPLRQIVGANVYAPNGHYVFDIGKIDINKSGIFITGDGIGTTLQYNGNEYLFNFNSGDNLALYRVGLGNFTIYAPNAIKDNFIIKIDNIINSFFYNLIIEDSVDGIYLKKAGKVFFNDVIFTQTTASKASRFAFDIIDGNDVHFTNIQIFVNGTSTTLDNFMAIRACDGLYFNNCHWHGTLYISPVDNKTLASVFFTQCYFDRASDSCVHFTGSSTNPYRNFQFNNCYFRDGGHGVKFSVTGTLELIEFIGCFFTQNRLNGLIGGENVSNVVLNGCTFADNNMSNSSIAGHITSNINSLIISGCQFIRGSESGHGVKLYGVGYLFRQNNLLNCNGSSKLITQGSGFSVGDNLGVPSKARGSATIAQGLTEIMVTHNLGGVTSEMIMVLPRSIITTDYRIAWVDENSFRILMNSASSSGVTIFTWWIDKDVQN